MHQMRFTKSDASVEEQWIVNFTRRFCNCKRCSMSKVIVPADYERIKCIFWIEPGFFSSRFCFFLLICFNCHILKLIDSVIIFRQKSYLKFSSGNLCDTYLQRKQIFLFDIFNTCIHIYKDENSVVDHIINFQWLNPGMKRYIG